MFSQRIEALLQVAATATFERIQADRRAVSAKLEPFLAYVAAHVFEPSLTIRGMTAACGVSDRSIASIFRSQLGATPREYVEDCRLVVASRLLRDSDLSVAVIAELVGYGDLKGFSRAVRRWCEMPPSSLRKSLRTVEKATEVEDGWNAGQFLRRLVDGELEPIELARLEARLDECYPASLASSKESTFRSASTPEESLVERAFAADLWRRLAGEPLAVQRAAVRGRRLPALFALLHEEGLSEHRDRRRKADLAGLALAVLERDAGPPDDGLAELEALAWASVGATRSLLDDLAAAEHAFAQSETAWRRVARPPNPLVDAEIRFYRSHLMRQRYRLAEAGELVRGAITILRSRERPVLLAKALVQLANVTSSQGRPGAISLLDEVIRLLEGRDEPYLITVAHGSLATAYAVAGHWDAAAAELDKAGFLAETFAFPILGYQVSWNRAYVCQARRRLDAAERLFARAEKGLRQLGAPWRAGLAVIDRALLAACRGRPRKAKALASQALPVLETLDDRATAAAYHLFRGDVEKARAIRKATWFAGELDG